MRCSKEFRLRPLSRSINETLARFSLTNFLMPRRPRQAKSAPPSPARRHFIVLPKVATPLVAAVTPPAGDNAPACRGFPADEPPVPRRPAGSRSWRPSPRRRSASAEPDDAEDRLLRERAAHASTRAEAAKAAAELERDLAGARSAAARSAKAAAVATAAAAELEERLRRLETDRRQALDAALLLRDAEHLRFAVVRAAVRSRAAAARRRAAGTGHRAVEMLREKKKET